jgi:hypothetical protein
MKSLIHLVLIITQRKSKMGNQASSISYLSPEELQEYMETTYLHKGEIIMLRQKYAALSKGQDVDRIPATSVLEADFLKSNTELLKRSQPMKKVVRNEL